MRSTYLSTSPSGWNRFQNNFVLIISIDKYACSYSKDFLFFNVNRLTFKVTNACMGN